MTQTIIIIGGGIGGLAAAVALKRVGQRVVVYEQAPELREVGAGITVWTNAAHAVRELGLWEEVLEIAERAGRTDVFRSTGRRLSTTDLTSIAAELGAPTFTVHRAELLSILAARLEAHELKLGHRCVDVRQDADGVTAVMESGASVNGAYLVAADGLHSGIRKILGLRLRETYRGYRCWRAIAPTPKASTSDASMLVLGAGRQFGSFPMTRGRTYWFATQNTPNPGVRPSGELKDELQSTFADWACGIPQLIESTPETAIILGDISDRGPEQPWTHGRITLLGDAAHASTPNLGQGACMALEDAVVLATCFRADKDPLCAYEAARFARTSRITLESRLMGRSFQLQNLFLSLARDIVTWLTPRALMQYSLERHLRYRVPSL